MEIPNSKSLEITGPITLQAWVRPDQQILSNYFNFIISKQLNGTGYTLLTLGNANQKEFQFEANTQLHSGASSGAAYVPIDTWSQVTGVWNAGTEYMYVNGILAATQADPLAPVANTQPLSIGSSVFGSDTGWRGGISDIRIWNVALSQRQIAASLKARLTGTEVGLVAYLPLNEGHGVTVLDASGNGNNGTLDPPDWRFDSSIPLNADLPSSNSIPEPGSWQLASIGAVFLSAILKRSIRS